ncbi:hypothetical protein LR48_Vigan02g099900 [Vigna angularis]|uniref:Uncharacterized protein n=1 Tax=Phaseolus angularis TaxID=3914 RepID=A0A0L9TXE2_PHAAN|nr:hypothetical protein LR48_Vigan02g099900 [Vigna angularis]
MCSALGITPVVSGFLHYYRIRPLAKSGWVSLTSVQDCCLFKLYSESFKYFKKRYFKVIIKEVGRSQFHDEAGIPLFPFCWTRDPWKLNATMVGIMTPDKVEVIMTINALPRRILAQSLVECLGHKDFDQMAFEKGRVSSKTRDPRSASFSHAMVAQSSTTTKLVHQAAVAEVAQSTPIVNLESSGAAAVPTSPPSEKKRKSKEGEKSSSKKSRRVGNVPRPIPGGLFDPAFAVRDHVDERKVFEDLRTQLEALSLKHEEGFNKALRQATYLLGVDPLASDFDISKGVYDGNLLPIMGSPGDEEERPPDDPADEDGNE